MRIPLFFLLLLATAGNMLWGQTVADIADGYYYFLNTQSNDYYLVPVRMYYYQDNSETPYLTTFQTGKDFNSLWKVEKVVDGAETYYRFFHISTGKYLAANDIVDANNPARLRLHLEAFETPNESTLFLVYEKNGTLAIRHKDIGDEANNRWWLEISGNNENSYSHDGYKHTLGIWDGKNNPQYKWKLESAPQMLPPTISYNSEQHQFTISNPNSESSTIHYTTDGSQPTSASPTYNSAIDATGVILLRAIVAADGTATSYVADLYNPDQPLLLKTDEDANKSYYLIPPLDYDNTTDPYMYVTTSNVPNPRMQWHFKAADFVDGVQYYHIVNDVQDANGHDMYLYCSGNNGSCKTFVMQAANANGTTTDRYLYHIYINDGFVNIVPRLFDTKPPQLKNHQCMHMCDGNNSENYIGLYSEYPHETTFRSRWAVIATPTDPRTLSIADFASSESTLTYFTLRNATLTNSKTYYLLPPTTAEGYATANTTGDNSVWFLEQATDDDTWVTYYYLRNSSDGRYLYFDGVTNNNNNNKFFCSDNIPTGNEDKYKFIIVKTANETYKGTWDIIPKLLKDSPQSGNLALNRDNNTLRTLKSRNNNASCWYADVQDFHCATPLYTFKPHNNSLFIQSSTLDATIYYTTDGAEPTISEENRYTGFITIPTGNTVVKAIAVRSADGSDKSDVAVFNIKTISSSSEITDMGGYYILAEGFSQAGAPIGTDDNPFHGVIDGKFNSFDLTGPLFAYVEDATLLNIVVGNATISGITDATGALANVARGNTRIYNCGIRGGSVGGSGYVGGLVGQLDGTSRVVNCYSFATITSGTTVGGIVGYNSYATKASDLRTMVMNCMMYGDITGGSDVYPVYGGKKITNMGKNVGVNNYNFYLDEANFTIGDLDHYNCSWPVEEVNMTRFDYLRSTLNSNRALCAWWITGDVSDTALVAKWVYAPTEAKYPILKRWGRYPSIINRDLDGQSIYPRTDAAPFEGKQLGTLKVTVQNNKGTTKECEPLIITDMDTLHHDYGYYKVQLPYYNDVFGNPSSTDHATRYGGNYTDEVVVGWEIEGVTGGTKGEFSKDRESGYNFADRHCTDKDLYSVSERIFAQGGYYYVPEGVTAISIKAHWATAYYCANVDYSRDRIDFNKSNTTSYAFTPAGTTEKTFHGQPVYDGLINAQKAIENTNNVYENAIVLVGNVQHRNGFTNSFSIKANKTGFTVMSVDLDFDDEPDYTLPLQMGQATDKPAFSPIRFDFVQVPDLGMVLKRDGDKNRLAVSCIFMLGHFEITETSALHFNELYFGNNVDQKNSSNNQRVTSPVIFNGGQTIEFVAADSKPGSDQERTLYIIAGGNAQMRSLYQGNHNLRSFKIRHAPLSVMGGEFDECYLSGNLKSLTPTQVYTDSPRLYTNGGRFKLIAGAGQESINGDVHFQIDHSIIDEFYGGATSVGGQITGNINVQIDHSLVGYYCGGPMVGDMTTGTTITTSATGTTFGQFFGAGNGGTSFTLLDNRTKDLDAKETRTNTDNSWGLSANYSPMRLNGDSYEAKFHFEIWQVPSGTDAYCAARRYVYGAQFATTKTGPVSSTLDSCTILGDFYGGGNLGSVNGDVTSVLDNCEVKGSVYGAGYSAAIPSFDCYLLPPDSYPWQDPNTSICHDYKVGKTEKYTWTNDGVNGDTFSETLDDGTVINYVHTDNPLTDLGSVSGNVTLTLDGSTHVWKNVFGGGNESKVMQNTEVTLKGKTVVEIDVFGGGHIGTIGGDTKVNIQ